MTTPPRGEMGVLSVAELRVLEGVEDCFARGEGYLYTLADLEVESLAKALRRLAHPAPVEAEVDARAVPEGPISALCILCGCQDMPSNRAALAHKETSRGL